MLISAASAATNAYSSASIAGAADACFLVKADSATAAGTSHYFFHLFARENIVEYALHFFEGHFFLFHFWTILE
jgi:hypothetical protein